MVNTIELPEYVRNVFFNGNISNLDRLKAVEFKVSISEDKIEKLKKYNFNVELTDFLLAFIECRNYLDLQTNYLFSDLDCLPSLINELNSSKYNRERILRIIKAVIRPYSMQMFRLVNECVKNKNDENKEDSTF